MWDKGRLPCKRLFWVSIVSCVELGDLTYTGLPSDSTGPAATNSTVPVEIFHCFAILLHREELLILDGVAKRLDRAYVHVRVQVFTTMACTGYCLLEDRFVTLNIVLEFLQGSRPIHCVVWHWKGVNLMKVRTIDEESSRYTAVG